LQQHHLAAVQVGADRQPADLFGGQLQRALRGPELLPQPDVLLGQLAVLAPRRGQLVLQAGNGLLQGRLVRRHRTVRRARLRAGRGQPPDHLHQQAPGQLVVVEPGRAGTGLARPGDLRDTGNRRASANPGDDPRRADGPSRPEADPVRAFTAYFAGDQPRTFHTRQQLRERHARTRVADGRGQLRAGHPVGIVELSRFCQVRHDALTRSHGPFSDSLTPDPHVSTLSPAMAIMPADDLMIVLRPVSSSDSGQPAASSR
jgi:hypothetical protein